MTLDTKRQSETERMRMQIAAARKGIQKYKKEHPGKPFPFEKYAGFLKGRVHFSDEDIEASKIRARDLTE